MLQNEILVDRPPIWSEPHELVFAAVNFEAAVIGESGVQEPKRVRKLELSQQPHFVALTHTECRCAPLADAVNGQYPSALEGTWKEGAGGVAFMMFRENEL